MREIGHPRSLIRRDESYASGARSVMLLAVLELIDSPDDVIALQVSDKITGGDLETIMNRLDEVMTRHDKVHVFVETHSISGIMVSGLPSYMARAMPLFGKLGHFGRVAVVADQAWIRVGTRLESALLPNISYRTYEPEERDEALAWVIGPPAV